MDWQERTLLLVKEEGLTKLNSAHVLVAGLGGVGSYVAEMLCRAGVGNLTIIDSDTFSKSNINRQIGALLNTVGKYKTDVIKERLISINPNINLICRTEFLKDENIISLFSNNKYTYVVDAIDTFSPKVYFIYYALKYNQNLVSSMGAGGKFDPMLIKTADFSKTYECRLAFLLRKRLRKLGIKGGFKAVFSVEKVNKEAIINVEEENKKSNVGTISYMPTLFGAHCAAVVIKSIVNNEIYEKNNINNN